MKHRILTRGGMAASWFIAAAPAFADAALDPQPSGQLAEIVITARKRPERLQEITTAAQVVSTESLAGADIADLSDLN
jgi:hypothetical protein